MKLKKLLKEVPLTLYKGTKEVEISGLCANSKRVAPGDLFIAKKGSSDDGTKYIEEAISNGALAVVSDHGNPFLKHVTQLIHPHVSQIEGALAATFYDNPSKELFTIGVTGTSGKTTTTYLIKYLLDALQMPCGLIGTIEYVMGTHRYPAERTTPDVISNHKMLREMCRHGSRAVAMEISSHGLEQRRVDNIHFDVAIFTNLSQDHLDYHHTMEAYADAKARLFEMLDSNAYAIFSIECPWSERVVKKCKAKQLTFGFSPKADLYAHEIHLKAHESNFKLTYKNQTVKVSWKQIGRYNILNCLAAFGALLAKGFSLSALVGAVQSFPGVPGRLERVENSSIFVDYAHKPDALEKVLECLREIKIGKIITIFGCGGDRDRGKRPVMGAIAEKLSDVVIVTSDNPRTEDPLSICNEIASGFQRKGHLIEPDRKKAIEKGIALAKTEDLILIAGKGHETYQIFAHQTIAFDDKKMAAQLLRSSLC